MAHTLSYWQQQLFLDSTCLYGNNVHSDSNKCAAQPCFSSQVAVCFSPAATLRSFVVVLRLFFLPSRVRQAHRRQELNPHHQSLCREHELSSPFFAGVLQSMSGIGHNLFTHINSNDLPSLVRLQQAVHCRKRHHQAKEPGKLHTCSSSPSQSSIQLAKQYARDG